MNGAISHLPVLPVLVPFVSAFICLLLGAETRRAHRVTGIVATLVSLAVSVMLVMQAGAGDMMVYRAGAWPSPFGIMLVVDRLSSLMVLLTDVVALSAVLYAVRGGDSRGRFFHSFLQLQLAGVHGAFLTGDLFNLFVFFEILLIASYCLLMFGGGEGRARAGVHYVVLNLIGSALFLIAVGTLYGVTGALNMAHLSVRIAEMPAMDAAVVRAAGLLLLIVFALKAAVMPLYFWLPNAYANASAPVAALFAIMTKVGVYCILRVCTLMFGPLAGAGADVALPWLLPAAVATSAFGFVGALASRNLRTMIGYLLIASVGTMLAGFGLFSREGIGGALYYLLHSTVTYAALFLIADLVVRQRDDVGDTLVQGAPLHENGRISALFFIGAIASVGLPPLAGFTGKALILGAANFTAGGIWLWTVTLLGSLFAIVSLTRAGIIIFWNTSGTPAPSSTASGYRFMAPAGLVAVLAALVMFAGPISTYADRVADQLLTPGDYVSAVLRATD
ncbi:MAG TPA: monovalent cation/H+ antiporter subunit D [Gemmatimonadales bacterium]|nr:monovalent cation/H+ antiporter subunit D [Gemmatimonadales bacterium]